MRNLLLASTACAFILAGCSTAQIESTAAQIEADIQAGSAALCGIIPTIGTILNVVGAVTGGGAVTTLIGTGIAAVEADICSAAPPAASARYRALPLRSNAPANIGISGRNIVISGWRT